VLIIPTIYVANADTKVPVKVPAKAPVKVPVKVPAKVIPTKDFIELTTIKGAKTITGYSDTMIIKNRSSSAMHSVRIMLSPDLANSFHLDRYAINSIEPNGNATVSINLIGKPNMKVDGTIGAYDGYVMVMAAYQNPLLLPVKINSQENSNQKAFMGKIAEMAQQRYTRTLLASGTIDTILSKLKNADKYDYEVSTADGRGTITSASDKLVIKSLNNELLKNVRILVSKPSNIFILENKVISSIEPNGEAVVHLISRIDGKNPHNGFKGEIVISPVNGRPLIVPIDIPANNQVREDFSARIASGSNEVAKVTEKITIKNNGTRAIDGVRLILPINIAKMFSLSQDAFQSITPGGEVKVDFTLRQPNNLLSFTKSFEGEMIIVSAHDDMKITIPIKMTWNKVSTDHFMIYYRDSEGNTDKAKAEKLATYLESKFKLITERFGDLYSKTKIYMLHSADEMSMITNSAVPYYYSYTHDIGFTTADAADLQESALHVLVYRGIMKSNPSYWNKQMILFDKGNWLVDGITNYIVASMTGRHSLSSSGMDASLTRSDLEYYAQGTLRSNAVTYTFFRFLQETYGEQVIDRTLYYLGSGMISNHRCNTLENCAVLRAVYHDSGMDLDDREYKLNFDTIVEKWIEYLKGSS
jgi:hypothetical protein